MIQGMKVNYSVLVFDINYIAHNLHTSQENKGKGKILLEKEILSLDLEINI